MKWIELIREKRNKAKRVISEVQIIIGRKPKHICGPLTLTILSEENLSSLDHFITIEQTGGTSKGTLIEIANQAGFEPSTWTGKETPLSSLSLANHDAIIIGNDRTQHCFALARTHTDTGRSIYYKVDPQFIDTGIVGRISLTDANDIIVDHWINDNSFLPLNRRKQ